MRSTILTLALVPMPALAGDYSCAGWDVPGRGEDGPITITTSDSALTWSNGSVSSTYDLIEDGAYLVFSNGQDLIITRKTTTLFNETRRVYLHGRLPDAKTHCG